MSVFVRYLTKIVYETLGIVDDSTTLHGRHWIFNTYELFLIILLKIVLVRSFILIAQKKIFCVHHTRKKMQIPQTRTENEKLMLRIFYYSTDVFRFAMILLLSDRYY